MQKPWHVYIVQCADDTLYTGATNDVNARIRKHNQGKGAKYTKARLPVILLWSQLVGTKSDAMKREHKIKRMSRKQKLELMRIIHEN